MLEVTINQEKIKVESGTTIIQAAHSLGKYIPHFCYHKKLSIAANCRMCLVEVEKSVKPLPACATLVSDGMVVRTNSMLARSSQKAVMEFLLINHPLDCPICDQGGECQLQDLAVGYGQSASRYLEEKRVVIHKNLGPLISAEEMSRCIHCTRCTRFASEVSGRAEIGMIGRGESSEIANFLGRTIRSELSGNMIDICPVGALTSKPFRYSARTWEMSRHFSVSPHDSLGSNLILQVKNNQVMRVVPFENEKINECWISDRDRFSYEGLNDSDRLSYPMIKNDCGEWKNVSWDTAFNKVAQEINLIRNKYDNSQLGCLMSDSSSFEEYVAAKHFFDSIGSENIDFRIRQTDHNMENMFNGIPWFGMKVDDVNSLDCILIIGSFMLSEHPLLANRFRQAEKNGAKILLIDCAQDDIFIPVYERISVLPSKIDSILSEMIQHLSSVEYKKEISESFSQINKIVQALLKAKNSVIFIGNFVLNIPYAEIIIKKTSDIANFVNAKLGFFVSGANAIGGYLANAIPGKNGNNCKLMLEKQLQAYITINVDPLDVNDPMIFENVLKNAKCSIALTSYFSSASSWSKIMLPIPTFNEMSGHFINLEGRPQNFFPCVKPFGLSKSTIEIFLTLGKLIGLRNLHQEITAYTKNILNNSICSKLSNQIKLFDFNIKQVNQNLNSSLKLLERIGDTPIYRSDTIVRHAKSLQLASLAMPEARIHSETLSELGINSSQVKIISTYGEVIMNLIPDDSLPKMGIRLPTSFDEFKVLGPTFCKLTVESA